MQVTVENLSTVKKALHIEIPAETVSEAIDSAYRDLKKNTKIKGFRQGKVPRNVLERMYKKNVYADVSQKLIEDAFIKTIEKEKISFVGSPDIKAPDLDNFKEDQALKIDINLEVKPEIESIDFKGIAIKKPVYKYSEDEVDTQIEMLRKNLAKKVPISTERASVSGDFILIDYEGRLGDESFEFTPKTENHAYLIGKNTLSPAFDENLTGMLRGETRSFDVLYDDNYPNKNFCGKNISFTVSLKEIHEEILPELDNDFAANFGAFETVEDIRQKIRENLQQGYDKRIEQEVNEQVFTALIDKTSFEVPDVMVEYELNAIIAEAEQAFQANGITFEQMGMTRESLSEEYRELAEKQVKRHLILSTIIDQEKLELNEEEIDKGIEDLARNFNQPVDLIKSFYEANPDKLHILRHTLLEKKAIQLILENSLIEEIDPDKLAASEEDAEKAASED